MKKLISILTSIALLILLTSCSGGPTPQDLIEKNSQPINQLEAHTQMNLSISQNFEGDIFETNLSTEGYIEYDEDTIHSDISSVFEMSTFRIITDLEMYIDTANSILYEKYEDDVWTKSDYNENVIDLGIIDISGITPSIFSTLKGEKIDNAFVVTGVTTVDKIVNLIDENATFISIIENLRELEVTIVMTFDESSLKIKTIELFSSEDAIAAFEADDTKVNSLRVYMEFISYETSVDIPDYVINCDEISDEETDKNANENIVNDDIYVVEEITNENRKFDIDILCLLVDDNTIELPMGVKTYFFGTKYQYSPVDSLILAGYEEKEVVSEDGCVILDIYNPLPDNQKAEDCKVFGVTISCYRENNEHTFDFFGVTEKSSYEEITELFGQPKEYIKYSNGHEYAVFVSNIGEFLFTLIDGQIRQFSIICTRK